MTGSKQRQRDHVLGRLLEVAKGLSASASLTEILSVIINAMRDVLESERATVFEYDPGTDELFSTVAHGLDAVGAARGRTGAGQTARAAGEEMPVPNEIRIRADEGLAGQCARLRQLINVPDAYSDPRFNQTIDQKTGFRTRSILSVPLMTEAAELIGVAQVLNKRAGAFDADDERLAEALASLAAVAMRRGRLVEDRLVRQKLELDLQVARRIQQSTFPRQLPRLAGYELTAWSEPAEATGGDAYDVVPFTERGQRGAMLLLADATGHGLGPALSVTQARAMLRMGIRLAARGGAGLTRMAQHMNQQLCEDLPSGRFITAWLGELVEGDHRLTSLSAGQAPLLHFHARDRVFDVVWADTAPFGVSRDLELAARSIALDTGDIFAVLSDGILEAPDEAGRLFDVDQAQQLIAANRTASAEVIGQVLRDAVAAFTGGRSAKDDRTAIILKRTG